MYSEIASSPQPHGPGRWPGLPAPGFSGGRALRTERAWRQLPPGAQDEPATILASRWVDERSTARTERNTHPSGRYVIGVALRPVRIRLGCGAEIAYEGMMPAGMVHVAEPGQVVEAAFHGPCDFVHFHVPAAALHDHHSATGLPEGDADAAPPRPLRNLLVRDDLATQLSRSLAKSGDEGDPLYAQSIGQTILMRVLALRQPAPRVGALPKWRLRRVQEHLAANLSEPISLAELAGAAGLSRMHFAAQFRVATGCRPHDYLLQQRIEAAKHLLATTATPLVEVALGVGFQTQSHFSTVFKRLTGETPGHWQRCRRQQ